MRSALLRLLRGAILPLFGLGVFLTYRWADRAPSPPDPVVRNSSGRVVVVRLDNAPFTAYAEGRKTWSLHAAQIDLERLPGAAFANIESASLTDIKQGILYRLPASPAPSASPHESIVAARFSARSGRYTQGRNETLTPDLALVFTLRWQFRLEGDVLFKTTSGDELKAASLTILEMTNRRTGKLERRIVCDQGAALQTKGVHLQSNQLRFNPADRTVECLGGAYATFSGGSAQSESAYWSPQNQTLTCPGAVSGAMQGLPFQAMNVVADIRRRQIHANRATVQIPLDDPVLNALKFMARISRLWQNKQCSANEAQERRKRMDVSLIALENEILHNRKRWTRKECEKLEPLGILRAWTKIRKPCCTRKLAFANTGAPTLQSGKSFAIASRNERATRKSSRLARKKKFHRKDAPKILSASAICSRPRPQNRSEPQASGVRACGIM